MREATMQAGHDPGRSGLASLRHIVRLVVLGGVAASVLAACGGSSDTTDTSEPPVLGETGTISMTVVNHLPMPAPCTGPASLTFFQGTTPVDIPNQGQNTVQVSQLFDAYQIGFQVNGWYWRTCTSPGVCPNPSNCQNPDNAGQVAVELGSGCSSAKLIKFSYTCDSLVPDAMDAVTVTLQSSSPCTVVIAGTSMPLTPTDQCCSCSSCSGSQIPNGQTPHCQA